MLKRISALLLCLAFLGLTACATGATPSAVTTTENVTQAPTEDPSPTTGSLRVMSFNVWGSFSRNGDGSLSNAAKNRIAAQHSMDWFAANCDHVLENDTTEEAFRTKCLAFLRGLGIMK